MPSSSKYNKSERTPRTTDDIKIMINTMIIKAERCPNPFCHRPSSECLIPTNKITNSEQVFLFSSLLLNLKSPKTVLGGRQAITITGRVKVVGRETNNTRSQGKVSNEMIAQWKVYLSWRLFLPSKETRVGEKRLLTLITGRDVTDRKEDLEWRSQSELELPLLFPFLFGFFIQNSV